MFDSLKVYTKTYVTIPNDTNITYVTINEPSYKYEVWGFLFLFLILLIILMFKKITLPEIKVNLENLNKSVDNNIKKEEKNKNNKIIDFEEDKINTVNIPIVEIKDINIKNEKL